MYQGYLEFGGVPIINAEATESYVANLAPNMGLRPRFHTEMLHVANEEPRYRSPVLDAQPWVNPRNRASHEFFGLYPLDIQGITDSTLSADVVEYIGPGGTPLSSREGTRPIRVSGLIVAATKLGAEFGLSWLRAVVRDDGCVTCDGDQMRFFLAEPDVCETAFGEAIGTGRFSYGGVSSGLVAYGFQADDNVDPTMPAEIEWQGAWSPETVVEWGRQNITDPTDLVRVGHAKVFGTNYIPNPTVRTSAAGWTWANTAQDPWTPTGGADDGGYLHVVPASTGGTSSAYGQGTYGSGTYGGSTSGATVSTVSTSDFPIGPASFSVGLRSDTPGPVTITMSSVAGVQLASTTVTPTDKWARYGLENVAVPVAGAVTLTFRSSSTFDVDQAALDASPVEPDYIDGSFVREDYATRWLGVPDMSRTASTWLAKPTVSWGDSNFRPYLNILVGSASSLDLVWTRFKPLTVQTQLLPYERFLYDVGVTQGPQVVAVQDMGNHGYFIQVDMTFVAGNPYLYGSPVAIDVAPTTSLPFTDPALPPALDDIWLVDPDVTAATAPPAAPVIPNSNLQTNIKVWQRYAIDIPAGVVADWSASVPVITINSFGDDVKQVRVRFHPNPFSYPAARVDPLAYCSEFVLSFLPGSATLTVNGISESVTAAKAGRATVSANHLLFGSDGGPLTWPELSCAVPYVMTIDVPSPADRDLFDIDVALALKE